MGEDTKQCLADAGCSAAFIHSLETKRTIGERVSLLEEYRKKLLGELHQKEKNLDCLDYVLYAMRR